MLNKVAKESQRETDLHQQLGIPHSTVSQTLRAMHAAGAVNYTSMQSDYSISDNPPPIESLSTKKSNRSWVGREVLTETANATLILAETHLPLTAKNIIAQFPESIRERWTIESLTSEVSRILPLLAKQGFLMRGKFIGGKMQSSAEISAKNREGKVILELIRSMEDALRDGSELRRLQEDVLPMVLTSLEGFTRKAAELYYPHSYGYALRQGAINRRKRLINNLNQTGIEGLTAREIAEKLGEKPATINGDLNLLYKDGYIIRRKEDNVYHYSVSLRANTE